MKKILFYGDSNTYGYDPRGPESGAYSDRYPLDVLWTTRLQQLLGEEWIVAADGLNGRQIPKPGLGHAAVDRLIKNESPIDIFAIMLGDNDYMAMSRPRVGEVQFMMEKLLIHLGKGKAFKKNNTEILVVTPPLMHLKDMAFYSQYDTTDGALAKGLLKLVEEMAEQGIKIRGLDTCNWGLEMAFDRVHLSQAGHERFAICMADALRYMYGPDSDPDEILVRGEYI